MDLGVASNLCYGWSCSWPSSSVDGSKWKKTPPLWLLANSTTCVSTNNKSLNIPHGHAMAERQAQEQSNAAYGSIGNIDSNSRSTNMGKENIFAIKAHKRPPNSALTIKKGSERSPFMKKQRVGCNPNSSNPNSSRLAGLRNALVDLDQQLLQPNFHAFVDLLRECAKLRALTEGRKLHAHLLRTHFAGDTFLGQVLVNMYAKCGSLEEAQRVFHSIPNPNVSSWTAIIAAFIQHGHPKKALNFFRQMTSKGIKPDKVILITMLSCFSSAMALKEGRKIHVLILREGLECDVIVGTALIRMYSKCGSLGEARRAFEIINERDVVAWTTMISGYVQHGHHDDAFKIFKSMQQQGMEPNRVTLLSMLGACCGPSFLIEGSSLHQKIIQCRYDEDLAVCNALVTMYGNCGKPKNARDVFDKMPKRDVVSWNAMIAAYSQHGCLQQAYDLFEEMKAKGFKPNAITIINILEGCDSPNDLVSGRLIHAYAIDSGLDLDIVVGNSLINMYGKYGSPKDAQSVFDRMLVHDVISWTALIAAYSQDGRRALQIYDLMQKEGVKPNRITFVCLLDACAGMEFPTAGRMIHQHILNSGLESDIDVGTALVTMYGRCGSLDDARNVFVKLQQRDLMSWNSMIAAYAQHGRGAEALLLLGQMQLDGFKPDEVSFISLLSSCSHAGLVEEGCHYYGSLGVDNGIKPLVEHYGCMVDLLGRAGQLNKAEEFLINLPGQSGAIAWMALLGACRVHGDAERGKRAADKVLELDPQNAACYVILASIYRAAGRWVEAARTRKGMLDMGVEKEPGWSLIEIENQVHKFLFNDRSHPQTTEIYAKLENLTQLLMHSGYVPNTKAVHYDAEKEEKQRLLTFHSERLAISFGLMSFPSGKPLHIIKNLRVCDDCHNVIKLISTVVERKIIVRDASRFHHFENGVCSCGDYW